MEYEPGTIILARTFETVDSDNKRGTITLQLGKPSIVSDANSSLNWRCPFQIVGIGSQRVRLAPGMDAIDAVLNALQLAEVRIKSDSQRFGIRVTWLGEDDLGLSRHSTVDIQQDAVNQEVENSSFQEMFDEFFRNIDSQ